MKRNTLQKQIVINSLKQMCNHPTASELYEYIHKDYPSISKATVFRILAQEVEDGKIMKVMANDSEAHYEMLNAPHYHMRCRSCGKVLDAKIKFEDKFDTCMQDLKDFYVEGHTIEFYGLCKECHDKLIGGKDE